MMEQIQTAYNYQNAQDIARYIMENGTVAHYHTTNYITQHEYAGYLYDNEVSAFIHRQEMVDNNWILVNGKHHTYLYKGEDEENNIIAYNAMYMRTMK